MSHPRVRQPVCVPTASSFCWFRLALCQRGPSSGRCSACGHAECQGVRAGSRASPRQDSPRTTSQSDGLSQALKPGPSDSGRLWALHLQAPDLPVHPEKRGCTRELQAMSLVEIILILKQLIKIAVTFRLVSSRCILLYTVLCTITSDEKQPQAMNTEF